VKKIIVNNINYQIRKIKRIKSQSNCGVYDNILK